VASTYSFGRVSDQRGETGFRILGGKPGSPRPPVSGQRLGAYCEAEGSRHRGKGERRDAWSETKALKSLAIFPWFVGSSRNSSRSDALCHKTRMSGSSERERVSEHLEESLHRLARSFRAPKSWDVSRREGWRPPEGDLRGRRRGHSRYVAESSQVFGAPAIAGTPLNPSKPLCHAGTTRIPAREPLLLPRQLVTPVQNRKGHSCPLVVKPVRP
jgi:hypothetical protein